MKISTSAPVALARYQLVSSRLLLPFHGAAFDEQESFIGS